MFMLQDDEQQVQEHAVNFISFFAHGVQVLVENGSTG
jgi:hypothetical protein